MIAAPSPERQPFDAPEGFDPSCNLCNIARHNCPGCGADVPHGTVACEACSNAPGIVSQPPADACRCLITDHTSDCPWVGGEMAVDMAAAFPGLALTETLDALVAWVLARVDAEMADLRAGAL